VVPSTTAAGLTSLTTGLAPIQHGLLGFRMRVDGAVLNVLRWTVDRGAAPDPTRVAPRPPFLGRTVPVVTRSEFRTSGFTAAHLRDVPFVGWSTPSMLVERCRELADAGHAVVYAYYPGVDAVAHEYGIEGRDLVAELGFADRLVGALRDALAPETALVVTADHGEVQVADRWIELAPLGPLVRDCSGGGRFRWLQAPRGGDRELAAAAVAEFGDTAWRRTGGASATSSWRRSPRSASWTRRCPRSVASSGPTAR
jgi:predicted AlkP superfamily pyrophosphatase or phosphodiesterase